MMADAQLALSLDNQLLKHLKFVSLKAITIFLDILLSGKLKLQYKEYHLAFKCITQNKERPNIDSVTVTCDSF